MIFVPADFNNVAADGRLKVHLSDEVEPGASVWVHDAAEGQYVVGTVVGPLPDGSTLLDVDWAQLDATNRWAEGPAIHMKTAHSSVHGNLLVVSR